MSNAEESIIMRPLIGLYAKVIDSKNKSYLDMKGKIVDETKDMIQIGDKKIIKNQVTLEVINNDNKIKIDGAFLVGRPEERLKKFKV